MGAGAIKEMGTNRIIDLDNTKDWRPEFTTMHYIDPEVLLGHFRFPESEVPQLNRLIGELLEKIQDASFKTRDVLNFAPEIEGEIERLFRVSTLSKEVLVATIRQNITALVKNILEMAGVKIEEPKTENLVQVPQANPLSDGLVISSNIMPSLQGYELLTPAARAMIDQFGAGCADVVEERLRFFAVGILKRAQVSISSLQNNIEDIRRKISDTKVDFSTLNARDFIGSSRRSIQDFAEVGLFMALPEEVAARLVAAKKASGGTPTNPATSA